MKWLITLLLISIGTCIWAENTTIFNYCTGCPDFIASTSSSSLISGSTNYIQNTLNPTTTTQAFNVQQGEFSISGFQMTDSASCLWDCTISTAGAFTTALLSCPSVIVGRPCTTGMPLGLLLAITCSNP
jgi:hypothetical protein